VKSTAVHNGSDFFKATQTGVADLELRRKLDNATGRHLENMAAVRAEFLSFDAERDIARRIKTAHGATATLTVRARSMS
jgi:hypothetical protein